MGYRRYVNNDPYWLNARFASVCGCGCNIKKGDHVYYYPKSKKAVCEKCGRLGENDLRAERSMDAFGNDCGYDS